MSQLNQTGWQIFVEVPGKAPIELPNGESVIGRSRASLVQIAETTVSRQHAIFVVAPGKVILRDLGSSNGTFVNGQRVDGEIPLADGDRVVVGEAELVLRMLAPLGPAEATAKLSIPPLTAPEPSPVPSLPPLPPIAPLVPSAPTPAMASEPPLLVLPASPPMPPMPPMAPISPTPQPPASYAPPPLPPLSATPPRISPSSGAQEPWAPTPLSRNPAAPAPALSPSPAPAPKPALASSPPAAPAPPAAGAGAAPATGPKGDELLPSISDLDLAPIPPPVVRKNPVVGGAPMVAAVTSGKVEPAGFWLRVLAYIIDSIPIVLLSLGSVAVEMFVSPSIGRIMAVAILPAYSLLVALVMPAIWGTTPGKKLLRLSIVSDATAPGQGLGWATAALRLVGYLVCGVTAGLGFLLVAFSARKQGLHDLIAKTNVVRKRPAAPPAKAAATAP